MSYKAKVYSFIDEEHHNEYVDEFSCDSAWLFSELLHGICDRDTCYNYFIIIYIDNLVRANAHVKNTGCFYDKQHIVTLNNFGKDKLFIW